MVTGTNLVCQKDSPSFLWLAVSPPTGDRVRTDGARWALSALDPSCSFRGIITVNLSQLGASSCLPTMSQSCQGRRGESGLGDYEESGQEGGNGPGVERAPAVPRAVPGSLQV